MPMIELSERDLKWGKVVEPAWYLIRVDSISDGAPAKAKEGKKPSTNYQVEGTIIRNVDTGSEEYAGVMVQWMFNSLAQGAMVGFLESFGASPEAGKRYELKVAEGKSLEVYVDNRTWEGRVLNNVSHKYKKDRSAA